MRIDEKELNLINIIPAHVLVAQAGFWKKKDTSKIKDYQEVNQTSDWTFSTPYKGTVKKLDEKTAKLIKD